MVLNSFWLYDNFKIVINLCVFCWCIGRKVRNTDPVYHPPIPKGFRHDQPPGAFPGNHSQGSDKWRYNGEQVLTPNFDLLTISVFCFCLTT